MEKIAVIGAGLVGSLEAILLAKQGHEITVFERRGDLRTAEVIAGRSINLALSDRGWKALELAGVDGLVKDIAIPMKGRMIHPIEGELGFQPYGKEDQAIYSVSRGELNRQLLLAADQFSNVQFRFHEKCLDIDLKKGEAVFENQTNQSVSSVQFDRMFGTDGAFSAVRSRMQRTDRFNYSQHYLPHGYKELTIPANADGSHQMDANSLHIWPRGEFMLIALPNLDGSFTCTLFFPFEGEDSFDSLQTEDQVMNFFQRVFPDAVPLMPTLVEDYFNNPTSSLVTVKCAPWNFEDKALLMGDASHAIVPFYGQGMNSGFEDCTVLQSVMDANPGDWKRIFSQFSAERKPDADAISDLALRNFIEMRDLVADPKFLLRKKIEKHIYAKYPEQWMPLYSMVTFSHIPYSKALAFGLKQDRIMEDVLSMENIEAKWDSEEVENRIMSLLERS